MFNTFVILPILYRQIVAFEEGERGTLHDDEIGVIDVELDGLEEVLHCSLRRAMAADEVLARSI